MSNTSSNSVIVDKSLIQRLERLSLITLDEQSEETMIESIQEVLNFTENLSQINTDDIAQQVFHTADTKAHLREDTVKEDSHISQNILDNAPLKEDNFFIVPKIIE